MDNKIITAAGVNINVDKHEDEKTKERRLMAYAFKMVRAESGMNRKRICRVAWNSLQNNAGVGTGKKGYATICTGSYSL